MKAIEKYREMNPEHGDDRTDDEEIICDSCPSGFDIKCKFEEEHICTDYRRCSECWNSEVVE